MKWLIYGGNGWIGSMICDYLVSSGEDIFYGISREDDMENEIKNIMPDRVLSCIGRTSGEGFNSIDYLEQKGKLVENVRDNLYCPILLGMICDKLGIHYTYMGTGCIFNGYKGYTEDDIPDFFGSSYSVVKGFTDRLMHHFENVLNVRIRMPIIGENHNKNFITKILNYQKICNMPNSMTVLDEMIPIMIDMAQRKVVGTINLCNPGLISHNEILNMWNEITGDNHTWENITLEQQDAMLLSKRSNNLLDTTRLESMYEVRNIKDAIYDTIKKMNNIH